MEKQNKKRRRSKARVRYPGMFLLKLPTHRRLEVERSYERIFNRSLYRRLHSQDRESKQPDHS